MALNAEEKKANFSMSNVTRLQEDVKSNVIIRPKEAPKLSTIFLENLPYIIMILLGAFIFLFIFNFSQIAWLSAAAYIAYGIIGVFWMASFVCPYCANFGITCPSGHGQISAYFKKQKDIQLFAKEFKKNMPVIIPIYAIPVIVGVISFLFNFNYSVLVLIVVFAINSYIVAPEVSKRIACINCVQKEECPWMHTKKKSKTQDKRKTSASADQNEVKQIVHDAYSKIASGDNSCCSCGCGGIDPEGARKLSKSIGYSDEEMNAVPEANLGLGCGNPTALAEIKEGDTVLDLGSGAGFDSFLAVKKVGKTGKVIGVDMTEEMIEKAKALAEKYGYDTNVGFRLGDIEALPVEDDSVDVIISNCVINLAPNKSKVFKEAYRVLKKGGKMYISDIVLLKELSSEQKKDEKLLCGCVAGALLKQDYIDKIESAGFHFKILSEDKEISKTQYNGIPLESLKLKAIK